LAWDSGVGVTGILLLEVVADGATVAGGWAAGFCWATSAPARHAVVLRLKIQECITPPAEATTAHGRAESRRNL
jgi:hypothetical protein